MSLLRARFVLALTVPLLAQAAGAAELKTLKGQLVKGDLVGVSGKEIVLEADGKKVSTPVDQAVLLKLRDGFDPLGADTKYCEVELLDSTVLRCAKVELKGKDAKLVLLQGQEISLPLARITAVLNEANVASNRMAWKEKVLAKRGVRDILAVRSGEVTNALEGTFGEATADGKIEFTLRSGKKGMVPVDGVAGLYFQRGPDPTAKPFLCKVQDTTRNLIYATTVAKTDEGFSVTTCCGVTINYAKDKLASLDYSKGKLTYLALLAPSSVKESSTEGRVYNYRRDENFDGGRIRIGGTGYPGGLCLHSTTELEYDLDGEYREFKAIAGIDEIDEEITDDSTVLLEVYADGNKLVSMTVSRKDKQAAHPITLNIKDVKKLKIVVTTPDLLDLRRHLALADARVSK
jgi:NPCBM/NEW2 domain